MIERHHLDKLLEELGTLVADYTEGAALACRVSLDLDEEGRHPWLPPGFLADLLEQLEPRRMRLTEKANEIHEALTRGDQ